MLQPAYLAFFSLVLGHAAVAGAQPFAPGQKVEASPLAMQGNWQSCTVNGQTPGGDYDVKCRGTDFIVPQQWIRPAATAEPTAPATARPAAAPPAPPAGAGQVRTRPQAGADRAGCPADGTLVSDRENRTGPIIGVANGLCLFRLPDGSTRSTLAWMLTPAGQGNAADGSGALATGTYVCSMSAAGGMFRITIRNGSQYADRAGKTGSYKVEGKRINFASGSLAGQYSEILGPAKFGLSTRFNGMFYGVCNLDE